MTPFWRTNPLTDDEAKLLQLTLEAHAASAFRSNASSVALCNAAIASHDFTKALTGALATLGGVHAPLADTYVLLSSSEFDAPERILLSGRKVPGWGNSFVKGAPDPIWEPVAAHLERINPTLAERLHNVTDMLRAVGKRLYPNPSAYTAAVAITLGIPAHLTPWLFVQGRLLSWSHLFHQALTQKGAA
jgi:citrate synthase